MPARVLVTGANGFLGRPCVAALAARGFEPVALGRGGAAPPGAAGALRADLLDPRETAQAVAAAGASHLLHLAWHPEPRGRWGAPANLDWAAATLTLARAFAEAGGRRMVAAGSCAEYAWSAPVLSEETTPLRPATLYGAAKAHAGALLIAAQAALGLSCAWARIFFCYGPGEPPGRLMSDLISRLAAARPAPCTDGRQARDYLHSADVAEALALILASDLCGPVNVASGAATPVGDLIRETARRMGRPDLPRLGALPRPPDDPPSLTGDARRLRALGFRPRFGLRAGVADVVAARPGEAA